MAHPLQQALLKELDEPPPPLGVEEAHLGVEPGEPHRHQNPPQGGGRSRTEHLLQVGAYALALRAGGGWLRAGPEGELKLPEGVRESISRL